MDTASIQERREALADDRAVLAVHLEWAIAAIRDVTRICEAVRYTNGLGQGQWDRVTEARSVADKAEATAKRIKAGAA